MIKTVSDNATIYHPATITDDCFVWRGDGFVYAICPMDCDLTEEIGVETDWSEVGTDEVRGLISGLDEWNDKEVIEFLGSLIG